jgi:hypothetical protein
VGSGVWCLGSRGRRCSCRCRLRCRCRGSRRCRFMVPGACLGVAHPLRGRSKFGHRSVPSHVLPSGIDHREQFGALRPMLGQARVLVLLLGLALGLARAKFRDHLVAHFVVPSVGAEEKKLGEDRVDGGFFIAGAGAREPLHFVRISRQRLLLVVVAADEAAVDAVLARRQVRRVLVVVADVVLVVIQPTRSISNFLQPSRLKGAKVHDQ